MTIRPLRPALRQVLAAIFAVLVAMLCSSYRTITPDASGRIIVGYPAEVMNMWHYSPKQMNDAYSDEVFHAFLKELDNSKMFFTVEDINRLGSMRFLIDDEIRNGRLNFYTAAINLYLLRCEEAEQYCNEILSKPFNFALEEYIELDADKARWPSGNAMLKDEWRKRLKYQTMTRLIDAIELQEKALEQDATAPQKPVAQLEKEAREKVKTLYTDVFHRIASRKDADWFALFVNAMTGVFDAHSRYLSPDDKTSFDIDMSGQLEGIGATLQQSEDYVKVTDIVPGSPSWLQGDLKVNDLIMKVRQEDQAPEEAADLFGMPLEEAVKLIRGKKGTVVTLTVRHSDGTMADIAIRRDVVIIEETYAKSAVLVGPDGQRVGYISLPKFYSDFNNTETGRSSARDVAAEVQKLKQEQVDGILLDLRSNTGGALSDAIEMSGLFITEGPVVQVKSRTGAPRIYRDPDPEIQYDGKLVVLVNALSASASEIVAAAMQDYGRAVIVGGASSFGKGTVQTVLELDEVVPAGLRSRGPYGSLIFTIQKFFRINGGATQLKGVTPDIQLPDSYSAVEVGEQYEDYCLPWSEIEAAPYRRYAATWNLADLKAKSMARVAADEQFAALEAQIASAKKWNDETYVSLHLETFRAMEDARNEETAAAEKLTDRDNGIVARSPAMDFEAMRQDTAKIARTDVWLKSLGRDLYLKEGMQIIADMK
ncbi:MAG: carboxy terminal-processing peptidase [Bacteroidales bacterium]|nr:carboxy terminal-processing peptidase [Bacteroidales bacterium]